MMVVVVVRVGRRSKKEPLGSFDGLGATAMLARALALLLVVVVVVVVEGRERRARCTRLPTHHRTGYPVT
jgi:hypothetical protein